jgi:hypothetical protein
MSITFHIKLPSKVHKFLCHIRVDYVLLPTYERHKYLCQKDGNVLSNIMSISMAKSCTTQLILRSCLCVSDNKSLKHFVPEICVLPLPPIFEMRMESVRLSSKLV